MSGLGSGPRVAGLASLLSVFGLSIEGLGFREGFPYVSGLGSCDSRSR